MKRLLSKLLPLLATVLLLFSCSSNSNTDSKEGVEIVIADDCEFYIDANIKRERAIGKIKKGEVVKAFDRRSGLYHDKIGMFVKVKSDQGDIGWIFDKFIETPKNSFLVDHYSKQPRSVYETIEDGAKRDNDKLVADLNDQSFLGTPLEVLEKGEHDLKSVKESWTKIKLNGDKVGWIRSIYVDPVGLNIPEYRRDPSRGSQWLYNLESLKSYSEGETLEWLIEKFGEPSAATTQIEGKNFKGYYFSNFDLYDGKSSWERVRFNIKNNKVIGVEPAGVSNYNFTAWLPLSKMFRSFPFRNEIRNFLLHFSKIEDLFEDDGSIGKYTPGFILWPIKIVLAILTIILFFLFTMLPIAAVTLFVSHRSINPDISTDRLILIQAIAGSLLAHLWYLTLIYTVPYYYNSPFFTSIFIYLIGGLIIAKMVTTLEYNRCPKCNFWEGFGVGSIWLSSKTDTTKTTTKTYKGDTLIKTEEKTNSTTTDKFEDFRSCNNCGHNWSIVREESR